MNAGVDQHRPRLLRLAHRMLGAVADAEDVVQDAYLRFHQRFEPEDGEAVRSPEAWLVTVVTRLAIDRLRAAKVEREAYTGSWLPEPWMQGETPGDAPDSRAERGGELDYAALVLLERLSPEERAAFLLREAFDVDYPLIAETLQKTELACRKLVQRARERLDQGEPRYRSSVAERRDLLLRLQAAAVSQDSESLARLIAPGATYTTDGGGKVFASPRVLEGVARVSRLILSVARKGRHVDRLVDVEGEPAIASYRDGSFYALTFVDAGPGSRITSVFKIMNPDKLARWTSALGTPTKAAV
jgi:RNA polymerase sigma-70 factor (ECF subfamily)